MSTLDRTMSSAHPPGTTAADSNLQEWGSRSMTTPRNLARGLSNASSRRSDAGTGESAQESFYRVQRSTSSIRPSTRNHPDGSNVGRKVRAADLRKRLAQDADPSESSSSDSQSSFDSSDQSEFSFDSSDDSARYGSFGSNYPIHEPKLESSHSSLSSIRADKLTGIEDLGRKILTSNLLQRIEQHGSNSSISSMDSASLTVRRPLRLAEDSPRSSCDSSSAPNNSGDAASSSFSYISIPCINPFDNSSISSLDSVEIQVRYYDLTGLKVNASEIRRIIALEQATATLPSSNFVQKTATTTPQGLSPPQESPIDSTRLSISDIKHRQFPKLSKSPAHRSPTASVIGFSTIQENAASEVHSQPVESQTQDYGAATEQIQPDIDHDHHGNPRQSVNVFINHLIHRKKVSPDGTTDPQLLCAEGNKGKLVKGILKARSSVSISTEREIDKIRSTEQLDKPRKPKIKWFKSLVTGRKII
ncbi:hypothetical protein HDU81_007614 [Chytriomyces hyalinus]|nr:hypothetical protein HDU81_007614 [Chytriomyces hyalinus]